jgi:hypothetical protein
MADPSVVNTSPVGATVTVPTCTGACPGVVAAADVVVVADAAAVADVVAAAAVGDVVFGPDEVQPATAMAASIANTTIMIE